MILCAGYVRLMMALNVRQDEDYAKKMEELASELDKNKQQV